MALLKLENVGVSIGGASVLEAISFTLGKGQRLGIIGEAGSGKSLLALAILGLLPRGATLTGTISFEDNAIVQSDAATAALRGKRIGAVFADGDGLDPLLTVGAQLGENGLQDVGLNPALAKLYPRDLTKPQRRLIDTALALAQKPDLLVADEPTAGLDLVARRQVIDLIERHCKERGMGLVLISHDLKIVTMLCSRIVVLRAGKLVEAGDKTEVFGHPKHEHTRALVSAGRYRARTLMRTPIGGTLLDMRGLVRRYRDVVALDGLSLQVRTGESLALIGPAGAGKSTLLRTIAGLERVQKGEIEFDHEIYHGTDLPIRIRRDISFVAANPLTAFNPALTIGESIAEPLRLEALRAVEELSTRIIEVIKAVGLAPDALARTPRDFTTGELQRLAIARALMTRPRLVLLDEPVASLDLSARGEILVLLNRLRADFGVTFLIATQDLDVMRIVADRVAVIDRGKIIETGTPAQLFEHAEQPLTQQLLAAALPEVGIVPVF